MNVKCQAKAENTPTAAQRTRIEQKAQAILDARQPFLDAGSTLADLYDPLTMPPALAKAHADLDLAVDRAYRPQPFPSDRHRFEFLFALYEQLTAPLTAATKPKRRRPTPPPQAPHPVLRRRNATSLASALGLGFLPRRNLSM